MKKFLLILVICVAVGAVKAAGTNKSVSFWFLADDETDVSQTLALLSNHSNVVTTIMLYCGFEMADNGTVVVQFPQYLALCTTMIKPLQLMNISIEFVLDAGNTNISSYRLAFMNPDPVIKALITWGSLYGISGWNLDLEPQIGNVYSNDSLLYAEFCAKTRSILNDYKMRLTICVADWSPMLNNYSVLAPAVDRLMDMETYGAPNFETWKSYYYHIINDQVPRDKVGIGIGTFHDNGNWSASNISGIERFNLMEQDNVVEVAMFRILPYVNWPESFWWPLLEHFMYGVTSSVDVKSDEMKRRSRDLIKEYSKDE